MRLGISISGATGRRNTTGLISYNRYIRSIEYAGMRGEMVLLMGDERVVPRGDSSMAKKGSRPPKNMKLKLVVVAQRVTERSGDSHTVHTASLTG